MVIAKQEFTISSPFNEELTIDAIRAQLSSSVFRELINGQKECIKMSVVLEVSEPSEKTMPNWFGDALKRFSSPNITSLRHDIFDQAKKSPAEFKKWMEENCKGISRDAIMAAYDLASIARK